MKELDSLIGYVTFDDSEYPFFFDKEHFQLTLIPSSYSLSQSLSYQWLPDYPNGLSSQWIKNIVLKGYTRENYNVQFYVSESYAIRHSSYIFTVNWVAYSNHNSDLEHVDGYKIIGGDIDYFYPPRQILEYNFDFDDTDHLKEIVLRAKTQPYKNCGAYIYNGVNNVIEVSAIGYSSTKASEFPLDSKSSLRVSFSKATDILYTMETLKHIGLFFEYITFRKNIDLHHVELLWKNEDGLFASNGYLLCKNTLPYEESEKRYSQIISYKYLEEQCASIIELFSNNVLTVRGIKDSIKTQNSHTPTTIIMMLSAFEREFRLIYGKEYKRSQKYKDAKELLLQTLDDLINKNSGKTKKYLKGFKRIIEQIDNSYSNMVFFALKDCESIIGPFILTRYGKCDDNQMRIIADRINELRNEIAHCKLDLEYTPDHLKDIRIVEILTYVIRLKALGLNKSTIQEAVNKLFDTHLILGLEK